MNLIQKLRIVVFVLMAGCMVFVTGTFYQDTYKAHDESFSSFVELNPSNDTWASVGWLAIGLAFMAATLSLGNRWLLSSLVILILWTTAIYHTTIPYRQTWGWMAVVVFAIACMFAGEVRHGAATGVKRVFATRTRRPKREHPAASAVSAP